MIHSLHQLPVRPVHLVDAQRCESAACLPVLQVETWLTVVRGGDVFPWIGPALRGVVARQLKAETCVCRDATRHHEDCAYGALYEPAPPVGQSGDRGRREVPRSVVLAPRFPIPGRLSTDERLGLTITLTGRRASRFLELLVGAISRALATTGLGPDHVRFRLASQHAPFHLTLGANDLADGNPRPTGAWPRVVIEFDAPVFLSKKGDPPQHRWSAAVALGTLWRASARTISAYFHCEGTPLRADYASLSALADTVTDADTTGIFRFEQRRFSSRSGDRYPMIGVKGRAIFRGVPQVLLPWIVWGGLLHVGEHRVAGAGRWRVVLG